MHSTQFTVSQHNDRLYHAETVPRQRFNLRCIKISINVLCIRK